MSPRFSVVIPLYNKAKNITNTINSVLAQKYHDFEIIVVDDGSTDASVDAVMQIMDDRIKLVSQLNSGVSVARNRGVEVSQGKYISFLDADDEWLTWHLEEMDKLIKEFPCCGIYSVAHFIMQDGIKYYPSTGVNGDFRGVITDVFATFSRGLSLVNSSTACVSKDAFYRSGGFPVGVTRGEDVYLWLKIATNEGLVHSARVCAQYNKDAENRSSNNMNTQIPYYLKYLDDINSGSSDRMKLEKGLHSLLYKGIIFTTAGFRVAGCMKCINELYNLDVVNNSLSLRLILYSLKLMPKWILLELRKYRHSKT